MISTTFRVALTSHLEKKHPRHVIIIPAIIVFVAMLLFWNFYELTSQRVLENKDKLKELGIYLFSPV